jgi:hypothetical protein
LQHFFCARDHVGAAQTASFGAHSAIMENAYDAGMTLGRHVASIVENRRISLLKRPWQ